MMLQGISEWKSAFAAAAIPVILLGAATAGAQILDPPYDTSYTVLDLGSVPGVTTPYGGLTFLAGNPGVLLIGGSANSTAGAIYRIDVTRDGMGHLSGFSGTAAVFATAPYIDGGLFYGPGNVLFATGYSTNLLHQILPGGGAPAKTIDLNALGICSSVGGGRIVPSGYGNSGKILLFSYNCATLYEADLVPDGGGTYNLSGITEITPLAFGPEGLIHVPPGSPQFTDFQSILVSEYSGSTIGAWDLDAAGHPVPGSRRTFLSGLSGAEGAEIDTISGDFVFSTFGGTNRLISVQGLAVPASPTPSATPTATPPPPTPTMTPTPPPITPTPSCCPGDANNSGSFVDAADFISVQANFGADNGLGGPGDANCSGSFVDAADFISVQANFGSDCG